MEVPRKTPRETAPIIQDHEVLLKAVQAGKLEVFIEQDV